MQDVYEIVSQNFNFKKKETLHFPFSDHGFLYGYGLFESIRVYRSKPLFLEEHLERLKRGSIILDIPFLEDSEKIKRHIADLISQNGVDEATLNIYYTAGDRSRDLSKLRKDPEPMILMVLRQKVVSDSADNICLSVHQESFQRTQMDRFKTLSWMKNVLERKMHPESDDVLLYSVKDEVLETCTANVFFVKDKTIVTPESPLILKGITRQFLVGHCKELGFTVESRKVMLEELPYFDEIFMTNALRGIIRVSNTIDYPKLKSGNVTEMVRNAYEKASESLS